MTWTAPEITRTEPPSTVGERPMLEAFLTYYRGTLLHKCSGLTGEQLARRAVPPSRISLLGLVRHGTEVERAWFRRRFAGETVSYAYCTDSDRMADFEDLDPARAEEDYQRYVAECRRADTAAAAGSLDDTFVHRGETMSLRWIYVHLIEEYARHCGHADLLRERVDGATGD